MKRAISILFAAILGCHAQYCFSAERTLKDSGMTKLNEWGNKIAGIYTTAVKRISGIVKNEDIQVPVYGYTDDGFTVAGYVTASISNTNISPSAGCSVGLSNPSDGSLSWGCPGTMASNVSVKDYGFYNTAGGNLFMFSPSNAQQICLSQNYGFASCLGVQRVNAIRASCVIGLRKVSYDLNPNSYCGITSTLPGMAALSITRLSDDICLGRSSIKAPFVVSPAASCVSQGTVQDIKTTLAAYRQYQSACNSSLVPAETNYDLMELDTALNEIQSGVRLNIGDVQGDVNPAATKNPWVHEMPKFEIVGPANQTFLVGNNLPEKLKVRVTPPVDTQVGFSVASAPGADWKFDSGSIGQSVILNITDGTAETGFKLGTKPGDYSIKTACADCCPNEVSFSAKAISDKTRINGKIKNGQCGNLTFGERTIPVNTDGTFVIDDVKLVAREENGSQIIDYENFVSTASCQLDAACPNGWAFKGDSAYPGCGSGRYWSRRTRTIKGKVVESHHKGFDVHGLPGTVVRAVKGGTVVHVGEIRKGDIARGGNWGFVVIVKTKVGDVFEYATYAHLQNPLKENEIAVKAPKKPGDIVAAGEAIGLMGNTGNAGGCPTHAHIEIRKSGAEMGVVPNNTETLLKLTVEDDKQNTRKTIGDGRDVSGKWNNYVVFANTCGRYKMQGKKRVCVSAPYLTQEENTFNPDCELGCKYYDKCTQK